MKEPVIYKIRNVVNNKFYVGSTHDTRERFRNHRAGLRNNKHHCKHLQASWNKYGEDCFIFEVVEVLDSVEALFDAENKWLDTHFGTNQCYNSGRDAYSPMRGRTGELHPGYGIPRLDTTKEKLRAARLTQADPRTGKTHSEETRKKISERVLASGAKPWLGKTRDEATKAKISAAQKGRTNSMKGKKMSEQGRLNVQAAVKKGEDSHFYGKPPANLEALKKAVKVTYLDGGTKTYGSLSELRDSEGISLATIIRACKAGTPIKKGVFKGACIEYVVS